MDSVILLDELSEKIENINANLTNTIGVDITSIKSSVSAINNLVATNNTASTTGILSQKLTSIINNTATNNTASKTGILSQKLAYLIAQNEAHGSVGRTTAGSQSWTCPAGVYYVYVSMGGSSGGGGGGRSYYNSYADGGAGGSGQVISCIISVTPGTSYTLTVGAAGVTGSTDGTAGGATSFGSLLSISGGAGGKGAYVESGNLFWGVKGSNGSISSYKSVILLTNLYNFTYSEEIYQPATLPILGYNVGGSGGAKISSSSNISPTNGLPGYIKIIW